MTYTVPSSQDVLKVRGCAPELVYDFYKFPRNAQALPEAEQRRIAREQTDTQRRNEQALQAIQQSISALRHPFFIFVILS